MRYFIAMKRVVVLQPFYLPWLGVFNQIALSDVFIFGDNFQYSRNSWINRNRIKNPNGGFIWLTVPVKNKHLILKKISQVEIDYSYDWPKKHLASIRNVYGKSPFFEEFYPGLKKILLSRPKYIMELNIALLNYFLSVLYIRTTFKLRSDYDNLPDNKSGSLLKICIKENAEIYLTGPKAKNYLQEQTFKENNILVEYQNYYYKPYQQKGKEFIDKLSIVDIFFMLGPQKTKELIYQK